MKWDEFRDLLIGIGPDTALGRVVEIRSENSKEILENFTPEQHRIRNEWRIKHIQDLAKTVSKEEMDMAMDGIKNMFLSMAGLKTV